MGTEAGTDLGQPFLYLAVLVSIIFGFAIQQVLGGFRSLILARGKVRLYWPVLVWSLLALLIIAQNWWESFGLANREQWDFVSFAAILVQAIIVYMLAAVVLPEMPPDEAVDLKQHYYRERTALYGLAVAYLASSPTRALIVDRVILPPGDLAFHGAFLTIFTTLLFVKRPIVHEIGVPILVLTFLSYIAIMSPMLAGG